MQLASPFRTTGSVESLGLADFQSMLLPLYLRGYRVKSG